jgi:hypothetical protein
MIKGLKMFKYFKTLLRTFTELLVVARQIDKRLERLEGCVKDGVNHRPYTRHIVTGHWND